MPAFKLKTLRWGIRLPGFKHLKVPPSPLAVSLCCSRVAACPLPAHSPLLLGRSSLPFASLQTLKTIRWGIRLPGFKHLKVLKPSRSLAAASTKPLAVSLCCSRVAACPLPAHSPLLLGRSSLPFASLQTLKTLRWGIRLPGFKHLKVLKPSRSLAEASTKPLAVSLCCSRVAACPLPAHSPLLLGRSSLPFASLQTLKTLRWGIRLPGFKHLRLLKPSRSLAAGEIPWLMGRYNGSLRGKKH